MADDSSPSIPEPTNGTQASTSNTREIKAATLMTAERVDKFLSTRADLSRSTLQRLFEQERILVNGTVCKKNYKVKSHDVFKILLSDDSASKSITPVGHKLTILHEDEHLIVLNKEPGMAVHPGQGEDSDAKVTLVHALLHQYGRDGLSKGEDEDRPGIVHRLDKDTSGLMIVCRSDEAHANLKDAFQNRHKQLTKRYYALVLGKVGDKQGTIETPLKRNPAAKMGHKMVTAPVYDPKGKPAVTHYEVIKHWTFPKQSYTLVEVTIETGRTHQIRVHFSSQSHPIVGDTLYATKHASHNVPFLLLTSKELKFDHPVSKEKMAFTVDLPPHFVQFMEKLDKMQETQDKALSQKKGKKLNNPYATNLEDLEI